MGRRTVRPPETMGHRHGRRRLWMRRGAQELHAVCVRLRPRGSSSSLTLVPRAQGLLRRNTFKIRQTRHRWAITEHLIYPACLLKTFTGKEALPSCNRRLTARTTHIRSPRTTRDSSSRWLSGPSPRQATLQTNTLSTLQACCSLQTSLVVPSSFAMVSCWRRNVRVAI